MSNKPLDEMTINDLVGLYKAQNANREIILTINNFGEFQIVGTNPKEIDNGKIALKYNSENNELYALLNDIEVKLSQISDDGFNMTFKNEDEFQTFPAFLIFWKMNKGNIYITDIG
jgi:hypothetical protein